ncbi:MAG: lanthionine synthetase C family protein [Acidobacteria bacterium]|nr:lanthionine synthetase C family protein [Acidobacteriota bacterium]
MKARTWSPALRGDLLDQALTTIREIADALRHFSWSDDPASPRFPPRKVEPLSLAGGTPGLALLYSYLDRTHPGGDFGEIARGRLNQAVEDLARIRTEPDLFEGFTGVAWAACHIDGTVVAVPDDDPNENIDEALKEYLSRTPWRGEFDLISGLVGIGVYALERLPRPSALECLEAVVERLQETSEVLPGGTAWRSSPDWLGPEYRDLHPHGVYDLGMAHGVAGVISLLAGACAVGVARDRARPLLDSAVAWLLAQELGEGSASRFSKWVVPGSRSEPSRLAWCYGDLGISAALLCAARLVGEPTWEREAVVTAGRAASRPADQAGVIDAGLCHGASGIAHIFNRFFHATGEERFLRGTSFWFRRVLEMKRPVGGVAGFSAWGGVDQSGDSIWRDDPGFLSGAAGIALALLAATTPIEPAWDRVLLLSTGL